MRRWKFYDRGLTTGSGAIPLGSARGLPRPSRRTIVQILRLLFRVAAAVAGGRTIRDCR
jgi:hypothetical protein